jgi:uncharacterized protein YprB with RNaseH-like and TPR domain
VINLILGVEYKTMNELTRCYFDIETSSTMEITVAGIYFEAGKLIQLVGDDITQEALGELFENKVIYTYNGSRFDLPFVKRELGLDVDELAQTHDLMFDCWKNNLLYRNFKNSYTIIKGLRGKDLLSHYWGDREL